MFAHSRDPHPAIKLWCQVPFTKSKTTFQIKMYCMQCFLKSIYIENRTFNDKNRRIIKKVMVFKKLLQHPATRGTYSPGDWRCDEAWRAQTLVYPPVMCQQRLIYCTWELNVMADDIFKCIFLNENAWIPVKISLKFVPKGPINNIPALVQIMAWRRPGDKPLSEPMRVSLLTHICVTRPQWVNNTCDRQGGLLENGN